jgi:hypothetical protein
VQTAAPADSAAAPLGTEQIVEAIAAAEADIRVQAYTFTSAPILGALAAAKRRGVDVQVVLDKTNDQKTSDARYSSIVFLANAGVPVWVGSHPDLARSKLIIIDHHIVVARSFDPATARTASAPSRPRSTESVTFTDSMEVAVWFLSNWTARRDASVPFDPPVQETVPLQTRMHDLHATMVHEPEQILEAAD